MSEVGPVTHLHRRLGAFWLHAALSLLTLLVATPLLFMVASAFKELREVTSAPLRLIPADPTLSNFVQALSAAPFGIYFFNSIVVATITTGAVLITTSLAGFGLARATFPGRDLLLLVVLASVMVPIEATFIPNFVLITNLGWYDSFLALIVPWTSNAFGIYLYRQFFMSIPGDIYDAARIDGASSLQIFRYVAMPMARAATLTVMLFTFLWSWNSLFWPILVTASPEMRVIQIGLLQFRSDAGVQVNMLMAATLLSAIPILVLYFFTQRYLVNGLAEGGVKG